MDNSFLNQCVRYVAMRTGASPRYAYWIFAMVLGHIMGWRSWNDIDPDGMRHNMYIILVGESTVTKKTTVENLAKKTHPKERNAPKEFSPEKFVQNLQERPAVIWWGGEWTKELRAINRKGGYMAEFVDIKNDIIGCPEWWERDTISGGKFVAHRVYFSSVATSQPDNIKSNLTKERLEDGYYFRHLPIPGEPTFRPRKRIDKESIDLNKQITNIFRAVADMCKPVDEKGNDLPLVVFTLTDEALAYFNNIEATDPFVRDPATRGLCGRYLDYTIALADIELVSDAIWDAVWEKKMSIGVENPLTGKLESDVDKLTDLPLLKVNSEGKIPVGKEYVERAWKQVRPVLIYAKQLASDAMRGKTGDFIDAVRAAGPRGILHSDIMKSKGLNADEMKKAVADTDINGTNQVESKTEKVPRWSFDDNEKKIFKGNYPAQKYYWIGGDS